MCAARPTCASTAAARSRRSGPRRPDKSGEFHIFERGQLLKQIELLENKSDLAVPKRGHLVLGIGCDVLTSQDVIAFVCGIKTSDDVHQRGFSAAGRADDRDEFMLLNQKGQAVDGMNRLSARV
jgi:hypothetical protein